MVEPLLTERNRARMITSHDTYFWILAGIQLLGVLSCIFARLLESTSAAHSSRHLFVVCLLVVGLATMSAVQCGSPCWASCGATLSLLSVGATLDLRGGMQASPF